MNKDNISNIVVNSLNNTKQTNPIFTETADYAISQIQAKRNLLPIVISTPNKKKAKKLLSDINILKRKIMETESALLIIDTGLSKATNNKERDFAKQAHLRTKDNISNYKAELRELEEKFARLTKSQ